MIAMVDFSRKSYLDKTMFSIEAKSYIQNGSNISIKLINTNICTKKILEEKDLPFELLHPLMEETLAKALQDSPARMQTGPAMRGDAETVRRHLNLLANNPEWREIYRELSENINPDLKV